MALFFIIKAQPINQSLASIRAGGSVGERGLLRGRGICSSAAGGFRGVAGAGWESGVFAGLGAAQALQGHAPRAPELGSKKDARLLIA